MRWSWVRSRTACLKLAIEHKSFEALQKLQPVGDDLGRADDVRKRGAVEKVGQLLALFDGQLQHLGQNFREVCGRVLDGMAQQA